MICDDVRALLTARADGELSAADSLRTESHLATCAACAVAAARHDAMVRALRQGCVRPRSMRRRRRAWPGASCRPCRRKRRSPPCRRPAGMRHRAPPGAEGWPG